jgi:hypothetical protein
MADECPYEGCSYNVGDHRPYARKRDGIPSVTQISSMLDNGKSRSFPWAASGLAATEAVHHSERWYRLSTHQANGENCTHDATGFCVACRYLRSMFDREWKAKANLGTHVHHLALQWARGEECEEDETTKPYLDGLERFYHDHRPEWLFLERTLAGLLTSEHGGELRWRGSFDAIVKLPVVGQALIDIKTGGLYPEEQTLQLAGYTMADTITEWRDGKQFDIEPMPAVDAAGCLFLTGDGDYRLVWLPVDTEAIWAFFNLLLLHRWGQRMSAWYKAYKEMDVSETLAVEPSDA